MYSYKFSKEILETKPELVRSVEKAIYFATSKLTDLSRPNMNDRLESNLCTQKWTNFLKEKENIDIEYYRDRVALKVRTGHPSFMGSDLIEYELASNKNLIDVGIYVVISSAFRKTMIDTYHIKWEGSITFEKALKEMDRLKPVIHTPMLVVGIDIDLIRVCTVLYTLFLHYVGLLRYSINNSSIV